LGSGAFVYLAVLLDVFTQAMRGWALSHGLGGELSLAALQQALHHARPAIHH
jgi:transposase InsO family protein